MATLAASFALTGCSIPGLSADEQSGQPTTRERQRTAAIAFVHSHPDVEAIKFTQAGSVGGNGVWAANAVVSVAGIGHQAILGIGLGSTSWEPWPSAPPAARVTVTYSDGTSEFLK